VSTHANEYFPWNSQECCAPGKITDFFPRKKHGKGEEKAYIPEKMYIFRKKNSDFFFLCLENVKIECQSRVITIV